MRHTISNQYASQSRDARILQVTMLAAQLLSSIWRCLSLSRVCSLHTWAYKVSMSWQFPFLSAITKHWRHDFKFDTPLTNGACERKAFILKSWTLMWYFKSVAYIRTNYQGLPLLWHTLVRHVLDFRAFYDPIVYVGEGRLDSQPFGS